MNSHAYISEFSLSYQKISQYKSHYTHFLDNKLSSFDVITVHLFNRYLHRVCVFELHNSTSSGLVIFISKEFHMRYLANLCSEQILEILPAKIIWNV